MKHSVKYIIAILVSVLFFIIGDIAVQGAWLSKIDNSQFVISHKLGVEKVEPKIILIDVVADEGKILNNKILEGLQIQLMDKEYKELLISTVKNGVVQFDLSSLKRKHKTFILISPITGNELQIDGLLRQFEMKIDMSEINIKQSGSSLCYKK